MGLEARKALSPQQATCVHVGNSWAPWAAHRPFPPPSCGHRGSVCVGLEGTKGKGNVVAATCREVMLFFPRGVCKGAVRGHHGTARCSCQSPALDSCELPLNLTSRGVCCMSTIRKPRARTISSYLLGTRR